MQKISSFGFDSAVINTFLDTDLKFLGFAFFSQNHNYNARQ
jgi:hypothetical protein